MTEPIDLEDLRKAHRRDYDPYEQATIPDHLAELADRRRTLPISYSARGNGCWVLTRYDDIADILRRNSRGVISFPNDPDGINTQGSERGMIPIEVDGARHKHFRQLLDPKFSPRRVEQLAPTLTALANRLIDEFIESGECDFVQQFAAPFAGAAVQTIMGWPPEDIEQMNRWAMTLLHGVEGGSLEETAEARAEAHREMHARMLDLIRDRRRSPRTDDVTSAALDAEIDGRKLGDLELFDFFLLMVNAGLATVQSVLAQSIAYLADHQDQWAEMFATPESLDAAIEELLRWTSPAVPTRTIVDESIEIGDLHLPRGERVHFPLAAANRDPEFFPDPDRVDFGRDPRPHLAFGTGPHRCVGRHLARLELRIGLTELHRRMPLFEAADDSHPRHHLGLAWGIDGLRLRFPPGTRETPLREQ
ncbi:cytochrome P450 [Gordonia terrae]|uniref:cytochrome P450 n=1 Tax=Gordonia terrae TaxID=2055 RepID=UPI003F6C501F